MDKLFSLCACSSCTIATEKIYEQIRIWNLKPCNILNQLFYNASDFEQKILQQQNFQSTFSKRGRFWTKNVITCYLFDQLLLSAADSASKNSRLTFRNKNYMTRQIFIQLFQNAVNSWNKNITIRQNFDQFMLNAAHFASKVSQRFTFWNYFFCNLSDFDTTSADFRQVFTHLIERQTLRHYFKLSYELG